MTQCAKCVNARSREWANRNRSTARARARKWQRDNWSAVKERQKKWRKENPEKIRRYGRKHCYGVSLEDIETMLAEQSSTCGICPTPISETNCIVDHCHESGDVRGLLCRKCNTGLGLLGDSAEGLKAALEYLRKS